MPTSACMGRTPRLPIQAWHGIFGDPTCAPPYADAIPDRLAPNAHRIELSGDSMGRARARMRWSGRVLKGFHGWSSCDDAASVNRRAERRPGARPRRQKHQRSRERIRRRRRSRSRRDARPTAVPTAVPTSGPAALILQVRCRPASAGPVWRPMPACDPAAGRACAAASINRVRGTGATSPGMGPSAPGHATSRRQTCFGGRASLS
jgi:hypothetical protein